ncbi:hypothetical protein JVT61DRAFT_2894 [Boletus reticuloceps]|uniref:Uncharacterized protein n=1 Tax=Boletus reticuloceps TaxID=495285 RepID=A0A8I2YNP8_9AGAM|nr:hypothetical protein JVT61DRAFT_2894 [Boletus reticuloceps]
MKKLMLPPVANNIEYKSIAVIQAVITYCIYYQPPTPSAAYITPHHLQPTIPSLFTFNIPSIVSVIAYPTWNGGPHHQDHFCLVISSHQGRGIVNPIICLELSFQR